LDKAPDAFRTISEVAEDLDIPQHVLRFWETRFAQIKPMKRSGGRRYYRPDDVDLLRGIRRLLYGEGYTIRGVQRILKEHGIASVQRLADATAVASFGAIEEVIGQSLLDHDDDAVPPVDLDDDDYDSAGESGIPRVAERGRGRAVEALEEEDPIPGVADLAPGVDLARLRGVLEELIACRQLLDAALKDGWLHTGDVGSLDQCGYLTLRDRSKDMIISGGSNIYPREIEEVLLRHPAIAEVSIVGKPSAEWGEDVVAFVVTKPGQSVSDGELDQLCLDHIARFKRPKLYRRIEVLPKNNYGKVLKTSLRQRLQSESQ